MNPLTGAVLGFAPANNGDPCVNFTDVNGNQYLLDLVPYVDASGVMDTASVNAQMKTVLANAYSYALGQTITASQVSIAGLFA